MEREISASAEVNSWPFSTSTCKWINKQIRLSNSVLHVIETVSYIFQSALLLQLMHLFSSHKLTFQISTVLYDYHVSYYDDWFKLE